MGKEKRTPGLFGLTNSNRDFSKRDSWGKNKFNSSLPAALCCYLAKKKLPANYLQFSDGKFGIKELEIVDLFGTAPLSKDTQFSFESSYDDYRQYCVGTIPRTDLVISSTKPKHIQKVALEVKLTAIPDNTTRALKDKDFGAELVIRPDTIFYLAAGLFHDNKSLLTKLFADSQIHLDDWSDNSEALLNFGDIHSALKDLLDNPELIQRPLIVQPVWKTLTTSSLLADNCLDVFAWSTTGFLHFMLSVSKSEEPSNMLRSMRAVIWTYSMLKDMAVHGKTDFHSTIDNLTYGLKNDKAFSVVGSVTKGFMRHRNLTKPRIKKLELREIILGGGQNELSPERRLDAIIVNSPELFG